MFEEFGKVVGVLFNGDVDKMGGFWRFDVSKVDKVVKEELI